MQDLQTGPEVFHADARSSSPRGVLGRRELEPSSPPPDPLKTL